VITVLLNSTAGAAGKADPDAIGKLFRAAGHDVRLEVLRDGQNLADAARAAATHASIVVAAGGDGTVSAAAAALAGSGASLGVLPLGTLNHFARDLHIPLDLEKAVATIVGGRVDAVDVGRVNDRVFVNNSSIGLYPDIVSLREQLRAQGHRKWPAFVLATARVLRSSRSVLVRMTAHGRETVRPTPFVFVGNNEYAVDGIGLGRRDTLAGGRLFVYLTPRLPARALPLLLVKALAGRAVKSGAFEIVATTEVWIDMPRARAIQVSIDGEVVTMTTPLHYQIDRRVLNVLIPPD
jgi:diacylglycerol kinase family enzyme